jgi:hypothetical protein
MLYNLDMKKVYLSKGVHPLLLSHLKIMDYRCEIVSDNPDLPPGIASHPDLFICKLGCQPDAPLFFGDQFRPKNPYPKDVMYNAACTGKHFIHNLSLTDPGLRNMAEDMGMILIDVKQGYTKCNVVVLDENSLITSDMGIHKTLLRHSDLNCMLIDGGHVSLCGYGTGFIGGASGRVGNQVIFHGALSKHPDFIKIQEFIISRELVPVWFDDFQLTDIGSIIEAT